MESKPLFYICGTPVYGLYEASHLVYEQLKDWKNSSEFIKTLNNSYMEIEEFNVN